MSSQDLLNVDFSEISDRITTVTIEVSNCILDPNNPRLAEARSVHEPEESMGDSAVQDDVFRRLIEKAGVGDLRSSIATIGYLPISMLVVRRHLIEGSTQYVVIEGNRRIAAIKWILREAPPGITPDLLTRRREQLQTLDVFLLDTDRDRLDDDRYLLQGIAHLSPIRGWPAFARAQACHQLEQRDLNMTAISRALGGGISAIEVGRLLRAYHAYMDMVNDETYGDVAASRKELLSYFAEVMGRRSLRVDWLSWNENENIFTDSVNKELLYDLIVERKIRRQTDIRLLPTIIEYDLLDQLSEEDGYNIEEAYSESKRLEQAQRTTRIPPWRGKVRETIRLLRTGISLPFNEDDVELLNSLKELAENRRDEIATYLRLNEE